MTGISRGWNPTCRHRLRGTTPMAMLAARIARPTQQAGTGTRSTAINGPAPAVVIPQLTTLIQGQSEVASTVVPLSMHAVFATTGSPSKGKARHA